MIDDVRFKYLLKNSNNVLLLGRHGVGKTEGILEQLAKNGLEFNKDVAYYSTHDQDFIGDLATATVIFIDNLNDLQAQKAAQEILNLKMWKGMPVKGSVFANYTIEEDVLPERSIFELFEVAFEVPYLLDKTWFIQQFGERTASLTIGWWNSLTDDIRSEVSPKRVASALSLYAKKGDIRDVLPRRASLSKLVSALGVSPCAEQLIELFNKDKQDGSGAVTAKELLSTVNGMESVISAVRRLVYEYELLKLSDPKIQTYNKDLVRWILSLFNTEQLEHFAQEDAMFDILLENSDLSQITQYCKVTLSAQKDAKREKKIRRKLTEDNERLHSKAMEARSKSQQ